MDVLKENATDAEVNNYIDDLDENAIDELLDTEEIPTETIKNETDGEKAEESDKDEPPAEANNDNQEPPAEKESGKDEPNKTVVIDDEYIKNADEEDRKILNSIKGETLSQKMIKRLVSGEHKTASMKGEKGEAVSKLESLKQKFEESRTETNPTAKEVTPENQTKIDSIVLSRLKAKFPDFPDTPEGMNDLGYEDMSKAFKYMEAEKTERTFVNEHVRKVEHHQKNSAEINSAVLDSDITLIKNELEKYGVTEKDLEISFEFDEKGDFKDAKLDKLFLDAKGEFDKNLVDSTYGVPIIKETAFAQKFKNEFMADFFKAVKNKALVEGAKGTKETKSITETMSNHKAGSQAQFEDTERKYANMTEEDVDAELAKLS